MMGGRADREKEGRGMDRRIEGLERASGGVWDGSLLRTDWAEGQQA
jgi:hypothetical protein